jgi:LytS/YehU family sensor histidine kinase
MVSPKSRRAVHISAWLIAATYMYCMYVVFLPWRVVLTEVGAHFGTWMLLAWFAIPLIRCRPLRWHWRSWLFHLVLGIGFTLADIYIAHLVIELVRGEPHFLPSTGFFVSTFKSCFQLAFLIYLALVGIVQGRDALSLAHHRELQVEEHKAAFVQAQLQNLRTQLQPHFLFNTLNTVASLMHYDLASADRMINRLSELLRISLQEAGKPMVSLRQEMSFIEAYLQIEKIRFEHRLRVAWAIPESLHDHPIPSFLLQPLVENAIKYGVAPRTSGGSIVIRAYAKDDALLLEVEDDAPEALPGKEGFGIGLSNTRARLETLFGIRQKFELVRAGTGTIARIRLPLSASEVLAA